MIVFLALLLLFLTAAHSDASHLTGSHPGCTSGTTYLNFDPTAHAWTCVAIPSSSIPSGLIASFNGACPSGWTEVTAARGRVIVGLPSSGTLAGTVGTAFTDLQDKSVTPTFSGSALGTHTHTYTDIVQHTHPVTDPGHAHTQASTTTSTGGSSNRLGTTDTSSTAENTGTATTGVTTGNPGGSVATGTTAASSAGTPTGTISAVATSGLLATIQYRVCSKD